MPPKRDPISQRDYESLDRGYETPCHIWNGPRSTQGYGRCGRNKLAHVLVYEEAHGPAEAGAVVHHRCEQKLCIRLDHLQAVTRSVHAALHRKFDDAVVEEVRTATGSTRQIAARLGISKSHVAYLKNLS